MAEVVCDVISSPVPVVVWYYQDKEITEEHRSLHLRKKRTRIYCSSTMGSMMSSLALLSATCRRDVEFMGGIINVRLQGLQLLPGVPPVLSAPQQSFNATADYQESVTLTSITSGSPSPSSPGTACWSSNLLVLQPAGPSACWSFSLLVLQPAGPSACWSFSMLVLQPAGPSACWSFSLLVLQPAGPSACWSFSMLVLQPAGPSACWSFNLLVLQPAGPSACWSSNLLSQSEYTPKGQHLELSERYLLHNADGGRSTLTIRNIGQADGGAYTCKATNKAGSQEKELFLKVF
ncbi:hypothetical protein NHX12_015237, partial [Muraenolepis orangiensis]